MHLAGDPGVVDHDVQAAEALDGRGDEPGDLFGLRDVGGHEQRPIPVPVGQRLTALGVDVAERHGRTLGQEALDDAGPETRRPTRDDRDLACQFVAHDGSQSVDQRQVKRVT